MKTYTVIFSLEAEQQLTNLYNYIAGVTLPDVAARYTNSIIAACEKLSMFPARGTMRDDIRPGLRITNYKKRAVIAYSAIGNKVSIIGVFYGGQDYEAALQDDDL